MARISDSFWERHSTRFVGFISATATVGAVALTGIGAGPAAGAPSSPIKHTVVIFGENISFDHYFASYPTAANKADEKIQGSDTAAAQFTATTNTPTDVDTLNHAGLMGEKNPNSVKPMRLSPAQAVTCDQSHEYKKEQQAFNGGTMDKFVENTSVDECASKGPNMYQAAGLTMGYYDGNTVTGMWNYAQNYAMNDNSFDTSFGPSTPGALNLISGQTWGARSYDAKTGERTAKPDKYGIAAPGADGVGTVIEDPDPVYDDCSNKSRTGNDATIDLEGKNVGNLLNAKKVSWGWFQGGFRPSTSWTGKDGNYAKCETSHKNVAGSKVVDYSPHHNPFEYYKSTSNPHHVAPKSVDEIGHDGPANHQYDTSDFTDAVTAGSLPAVSFVKAPSYEDGHAAYSDPLDEQRFVIDTVNAIQKSPEWSSTAIVLAYDDSDGWYDHKAPTILTGSKVADEDAAICMNSSAGLRDGHQAQCGPGTRQPLIVISPYSKKNYVDHTATETASVLKFVEDNYDLGRVGAGSADERAGSIDAMFDFSAPARADHLYLSNANGSVVTEPGASAQPDGSVTPSSSAPQAAAGSDTDSSTPAWEIVAPIVVVMVLVGAGAALWMRSRRSTSG